MFIPADAIPVGEAYARLAPKDRQIADIVFMWIPLAFFLTIAVIAYFNPNKHRDGGAAAHKE